MKKIFWMGAAWVLALAGPAGGTVVAGQATINGAPGATVYAPSLV